MYISKKHVSRRTILKGLGVTVALPLLDAMVPARTVFAKTAAGASAAKQRLVCMEMVHGNAGFAGTSLDQLYAQQFGQDTPIPSMQLSIENVDQAGGCTYGYSCIYTDTISWSSPTQPLPMIRDPRVVFDQLFGVGATL